MPPTFALLAHHGQPGPQQVQRHRPQRRPLPEGVCLLQALQRQGTITVHHRDADAAEEQLQRKKIN